MTSTPVEPQRWPFRRWLIGFVLVLAVQAALFFSLGNFSPTTPLKPNAAPSVRLRENTSDRLFLDDPTLFALPHQEGFSGDAWLRIPPLEFHPMDWSEPPRPLPLSVAQLGAEFENFVQTHRFASFEITVKPQPDLTMPEIPPVTPLSTPSTLRIEGGLARRRLLSPLELPPQPSNDLLTNSVVQLMVDALGNPISEVLLSPGSGSQKEADQRALELAKSARFEPIEIAGPGRKKNPDTAVTLGTMVFEWQTIPMPSTNTTTTTPAIQ
jgi:hypothetical protein